MSPARLAGRLRLPWPGHVWALCLLVPVTLLLGYKVFLERDVPFDGWINYQRATRIDRQRAGYTELPAHHGFKPAGRAGAFECYAFHWHMRNGRGYYRYDLAHWPGGDPGLGDRNPLPPSVDRHEAYALHPGIPLAVLVAGWVVWLRQFARHHRRQSSPGHGFDVLPPTRPADSPALADRGR